MAAQVMANVRPLGIPSIAPLIRENLGLSVTQALLLLIPVRERTMATS